MGMRDVNRDNFLAVKLLELRRHLVTCRQCKAALKTKDEDMLCGASKALILKVALKWDANIPGRLAGTRSKQRLQFLCPDPNAHGAAYAATAEAVTVTGMQEGLF